MITNPRLYYFNYNRRPLFFNNQEVELYYIDLLDGKYFVNNSAGLQLDGAELRKTQV